MGKAVYAQTSFAGGEQSPRLIGRSDIAKYPIGCTSLENFIVMLEGGITRRTGFALAHTDSYRPIRLIEFAFSTIQNYILQFYDDESTVKIRFFRDNGIIESSPGTIYSLATTYTEQQVLELKYVQSADVLYLFHKSVPPKKLTRTGHASWTITDISFVDGPYQDTNTTATTLTVTLGTVGTGRTCTASTAIFVSTDVGRLIRVKSGTNWGYLQITAFVSATVVTVTIIRAVGTSATTTWALGLYSQTTGYPACGTFHEERLWLGGTTQRPQTLVASVSGAFESMDPTDLTGNVLADSSMVYTIASSDVNSITDLVSGKVLAAFTSSGEFIVSASSLNEAITPTNIKVTRSTTRGTKSIRPIKIDSQIIYVQISGKKLREFAYSFQDDEFKSIDLSVLSSHIIKQGIKDIVFCQEPYSLVWCLLESNNLVCLTYNREQDTIAWHKHYLGGTDANVISIASIRSTDGTYNELWASVSRTVGGSTLYTTEYLSKEYDLSDSSNLPSMNYLDCSLTYSGSPASTISGLDHLIGETVSILADGAVIPDQDVSNSGTITLSSPASTVIIGYSYRSLVTTRSIEVAGNFGSPQGQIGRISKINLLFNNTLGGRYGSSLQNLRTISTRNTLDNMDSPPPLFSGYSELVFDMAYSKDKSVTVVQDTPYPCEILAAVAELVTNG